MVASDIDLIALILREPSFVIFVVEMPLADKCCLVAVLVKGFRNRNLLQRQNALGEYFFQGGVVSSRPGDPVGQPIANGILPCLNACTGGRTNGSSRVCVGKTRALTCQSIDIRRFVQCVAIASDVRITKIIHEDEKNIRRLGC